MSETVSYAKAQNLAGEYLKLLRRQKLVVVINLVLIAAALVLMVVKLLPNPNFLEQPFTTVLTLLFMCVAMLLSQVLFRYFQPKKEKALFDILYIDCDPESFIIMLQILSGHQAFRSKQSQIMVALNIIYGLILSGQYEKAFGALSSIDIEKASAQLQVVYNEHLANCLDSFGEYQELYFIRERVFEISRKFRSTQSKKFAESMMMFIDAYLATHIQNYSLAIEQYTSLLRIAKYPGQRLVIYTRLARVHFLIGDYQTAVELCNYIVTNGNKLYCVAQARALLERMGYAAA